jgi:hypothetical protein
MNCALLSGDDMTDLLHEVLDAHGGLARWQRFST